VTPITKTTDNGAVFTLKISNSLGAITSNAVTLNVNIPTTAQFLRYYKPSTGLHFYTVSVSEGNSSGYNYEGAPGYVYTTQAPNTVPLYRYVDPSQKSAHFYTASYAELGGGTSEWKYEGIACYIYPTQMTGTLPLYRYVSLHNADHFYTANYSELGGGNSTYRYEGVAGYILASSTPIY
jgi:hypothetical protein